MAESTYITKTKYCSGVQCPKMLWLKTFRSELLDNSVMNQAVLEAGTKVGELARGLFGDYTLVEYGDPNKMAQKTKALIATEEKVIAEAKLNDAQQLQVRHELEDIGDHIEKDKIKEFLDTLTYPLYFLDFEAYQSAIPPFEGSWPDEQIPFQYSLHYIEKKGEKEKHTDFLAEQGKDPRREVAERLCQDIPMNVCVLAYYMSFERGRIEELANLYPDLAEHLMNIHDNIHDLIVPFQKKQYYNKAMKGSASINPNPSAPLQAVRMAERRALPKKSLSLCQ